MALASASRSSSSPVTLASQDLDELATTTAPRRRSSHDMVRILKSTRSDPSRIQSFADVIDELSMLELALKHIRSVLIERSSSIRATFRALDRESYGYIDIIEFRGALDDVIELSLEEKNMVCAFANASGTGKIDYLAFFNLLFRDHYQIKRELIARSSLRQVVVIFRHGARFPLKPFPFDASWPKDDLFWKTYGGKLTPTGHAQSIQVGAQLRRKYLLDEHLLGEDDPNLPDELYVYTSNSDRTLTSAQSVVLGMFPNVAQSFAIETATADALGDTDDQDDYDDQNRTPHQSIKIHLADLSMPYRPLLHGYKNNPRFAALKAEQFAQSPFFEEAAADPAYQVLLDKLYKMTGFHAICPDRPNVERVQMLQSLAQQIAIERAHYMRVFSNPNRIWLEPDDERLIRNVADYAVRLRYQGMDENTQRQLAQLAAGTLPIELVNGFDAVIEQRSMRKLALYSAHDNTLMALLSHLGFRDWPVPQFGAHCIFELHQDDNEDDWIIRFAYNDQSDRLQTMQYVQLPMRDEIRLWANAVPGHVRYQDWSRGLLHDRYSICDEQDFARRSQI